MEKAYELKALGLKLKARGLDLAEDAAKIIVEETLSWVGESAVMSPTPFDDVVAVVMPPLKGLILAQVDKIDGVVGA